MQDADNLNRVPDRPIEDEMIPETRHRPDAKSLELPILELARAADPWQAASRSNALSTAARKRNSRS